MCPTRLLKESCKSPRGIFSWPLAHSSSHQELSKDPFQNVLMCLQAPAPTQNLQKWANSPKMAVFYDHHFHYCYHEPRKKKTILEMSLPLSLVASYCSDRRGSRRIRGSIPEKSATVPAYSCSSVPQKIIHEKKKINQSLRPSPNGNSLIYRRTRTCCCAKDRKD